MSTRHGKDGVVKVGSVTIAEIDNWSLNSQAAVANDTAMGDTWETHIPSKTINSWNGSLTCHYDPTDLTGQGALDVGVSVTLKLYGEGTATGAIGNRGGRRALPRETSRSGAAALDVEAPAHAG